ncbi:MAG: hypothetical protein H0U37_00780 [Chloroflexi bacterium]|nr:hypothetical protein [Chloroflexota bacterium]
MIARPRRIRRTGAVLLAVLAAVTLAVPAAAGGAQVTRGTFHAFSANTALDISGHAVMVRTADGRTFVSVHLEGLAANTAYGSHIHKQACSDNFAGTHYRFDPAGPADDVNEIWPAFTTNGAGIGNGNARNDGTADSTAVSVVVHAPGGVKITCADLG